jgi:hypothetical protein
MPYGVGCILSPLRGWLKTRIKTKVAANGSDQLLGAAGCLNQFLDVDPVGQDQGEGGCAYDHPEGYALEKRTDSDLLQGFLVQAGADQK